MFDFLDAVADGDMERALKIGCRNEGEQIDLFGTGGIENEISTDNSERILDISR